MEMQAEENHSVDYLDNLLRQVTESTARLDIEKVQMIKTLVKDLLKTA